MKMRTIKLTPEFVAERLYGKTSSLISNLPNDIELLDIKYDLFSKQVIAVIRSDSFEDTTETYPIPEFKLTYSSSLKNETQFPSPPLLKTGSKPTPVLNPEPVVNKSAAVTPRRDTSIMEEEFTDEQRKLLNFSVDGDFVVVKPKRFLKGEWEDINDVVRSLGGRWVKGDIVSYWEIPLP